MANQRLIPSMDAKLVRWAEHINQEAGQSTGCNMIAKAMDGGGLIVRSTNPDVGSLPDDVYDLDKLIKKLEDVLQVVVREHYQHADCELAQRYKQCGCGRDTYYRRLSKAHHSLVFLGKPLKERKVKLSTV